MVYLSILYYLHEYEQYMPWAPILLYCKHITFIFSIEKVFNYERCTYIFNFTFSQLFYNVFLSTGNYEIMRKHVLIILTLFHRKPYNNSVFCGICGRPKYFVHS